MNTAIEAVPSGATAFARVNALAVRMLIVASVSFALLPVGLDWSYINPHGSLVEGSMLFQLEFGAVFLLGAWLAWRNRQICLRQLPHLNPLLILLILYCLASALWSPYPLVTIKRSAQLIGLTMVGLTIAPPVGGRQQLLHTLLGTLMVLMVLSFFVALLLPAVGIDYELGGAWRGVLPQKNTLGAISGLCMVLCVKESRNHYYPRWLCYVGVLFSLFMLVMSKSSTATLVAVMGIAIYLLSRRRYFKDQYDARRLLLILFMLLLLGLHLFYVTEARLPRWDELFAPVGALFNKSSDLTGRTDIWRMVLLEIDKHPDFGLGYGAFWLGEGSLSQSIIDALHWVPLQAHNGYLDILNELGIVGFCIMLGVFVMHIWSLIKLTPIDREEAAIHWGILFLILISNLSESEVFRGVLFQNIFFLYSSTSISARLSLHRMAQGNMHNHKRQASS